MAHGAGGRRPKPAAIHRLNGNPSMLRKSVLNEAENPTPQLGVPERPRRLSRAAKREWKRIVPLLMENDVLSIVDGKALAAYCECYARWEEVSALIDKYGQVVQTSYQDKTGEIVLGDLKANPACNLAKMWMAQMKSFLCEFGLTPASRRNLKIQKKSKEDPMEAFLRGNAVEGTQPAPVDPEAMSAGDEEAEQLPN